MMKIKLSIYPMTVSEYHIIRMHVKRFGKLFPFSTVTEQNFFLTFPG